MTHIRAHTVPTILITEYNQTLFLKGPSCQKIPTPLGRRERNKQAKLDRIVAAAGELFAEYGVDDVTTQQIADKADIGAGTLFLYAKSKGELLLMVQNSSYADSLAQGQGCRGEDPRARSRPSWRSSPKWSTATAPRSTTAGPTCAKWFSATRRNPTAARRSTSRNRPRRPSPQSFNGISAPALPNAATLAHVISAIMFLTMSATGNATKTIEELLTEIRTLIQVLLPNADPRFATQSVGDGGYVPRRCSATTSD